MSSGSSGSSSTPLDPPKRPMPSLRVAPTPAPKVKTAANVVPLDPSVRYELLRLQEFQGLPKAYIMDHAVESASLIKVGETIGDCTLVEISPRNESIRLKPSGGLAFTVKLAQSAK